MNEQGNYRWEVLRKAESDKLSFDHSRCQRSGGIENRFPIVVRGGRMGFVRLKSNGNICSGSHSTYAAGALASAATPQRRRRMGTSNGKIHFLKLQNSKTPLSRRRRRRPSVRLSIHPSVRPILSVPLRSPPLPPLPPLHSAPLQPFPLLSVLLRSPPLLSAPLHFPSARLRSPPLPSVPLRSFAPLRSLSSRRLSTPSTPSANTN